MSIISRFRAAANRSAPSEPTDKPGASSSESKKKTIFQLRVAGAPKTLGILRQRIDDTAAQCANIKAPRRKCSSQSDARREANSAHYAFH